jgi:hypothetical protein
VCKRIRGNRNGNGSLCELLVLGLGLGLVLAGTDQMLSKKKYGKFRKKTCVCGFGEPWTPAHYARLLHISNHFNEVQATAHEWTERQTDSQPSKSAQITPIVFSTRNHIEVDGALRQQSSLDRDDLIRELIDLRLQLAHLACLLGVGGAETLMLGLPLGDLHLEGFELLVFAVAVGALGGAVLFAAALFF